LKKFKIFNKFKKLEKIKKIEKILKIKFKNFNFDLKFFLLKYSIFYALQETFAMKKYFNKKVFQKRL